MTRHAHADSHRRSFLDRCLPGLAGEQLPTLSGTTIRTGSRLGRALLADRAHHRPQWSAQGSYDALAELPDTELDADALCEAAIALALRPVEADDLVTALALYDRAAALLGRRMDPRHRAVYTRLAVSDGAPDRIATIRSDIGIPAEFEAAVDAELAHPTRAGDTTAFLGAFGRFAGWADLGLADAAPSVPLLDRLRSTATRQAADGPLISIVMTCHRPGPELLTAVRSVAAQTWRRWELLLVDDASGPDFDPVLQDAAALDRRVRVLRQKTNGGTYRARNRALAQASGEFVTGLDSDDWACPRWLEEQVAPLIAEPDLVMTASHGIRVTDDLGLFGTPGRRLSEVRSTSIMFRAEPVRQRIGFYDVTAKGADSEFRLRLQKAFGSRRWRRLDANHTLIRQRPQSLSGGEVGEGWMHPLRIVYESAFHHWHRDIQSRRAKPFLAASASKRPFPAPRQLLAPGDTPGPVDRLYIGDWRYDGPAQRAMLDAIAADVKAGAKVAIAHYPSWLCLEERHIPIGQPALLTADELGVDWLDPATARATEAVVMDETIEAAVHVDFPDASIASIEVMPPAPDAEASPAEERRRPRRRRNLRLRPLAGRLVRLSRRLLRGKRAVLRRLAGKAVSRLRALRFDSASPKAGQAPLAEWQREELEQWKARLYNGWSGEASLALTDIARSAQQHPVFRLAAMETLVDWYDADDRAERRDLELDIVLVSNFSLPGGSSSSNAEEIRAFRRAGLRVGLVHHPVYDWPIDKPLNPKIAELIDGEAVVRLSAHDTVRCDLTIVRFPRIMMRPMDDLPTLAAAQTILVVNQPPYEFYGPAEGRQLTWDIGTVHKNLSDWLGRHIWYPQGPVVRRVLEQEHATELAAVDVADGYWFGVLDPDEWRREGRRPQDGTIRIGRHARDHVRKWPETVQDLTASYPAAEDIEIRVLGGARTPERMLRGLPPNWTVHAFGAMPVREFLHDLDVMVFFIAESGDEAFGRTPLEAMAAGLPCLLPRSFEALYGDAALYCEPHEVEGIVRELMDDPDYYDEQVRRALARVERDFSYRSLLERVGAHGVDVGSGALDSKRRTSR